jgi:nucleolar protein 16
MGRELQKKKNKSSIPKRRQNPKSKKKILQNPIIAAHWNPKETLTQNYRRLGLTSRLNHVTGGTEKSLKLLGVNDPSSSRADAASGSTADVLNIASRKPIAATTIVEAEVERDPETGKVLRIINDPSATKKHNPLNDPLNELEDSEPEEWSGFAHVPEDGPSENSVIRQLEEAARNGARKAPRKQSHREEEWIEKLVAKYGNDYGKMFRDSRLNPYQQSEGDIKRRVQKWKKNHDMA